MMPPPQDNWTVRDTNRWLRELASRLRWGSFTWVPPVVGGGAVVDTVISVPDARIGLAVIVTPPAAIPALMTFYAFCATDRTITVRLQNHSGGLLWPAAGDWSWFGCTPL